MISQISKDDNEMKHKYHVTMILNDYGFELLIGPLPSNFRNWTFFEFELDS